MSVVNRIRIGFALPLILLTFVGAISYRTASQITEATRSVEHTQALIAKLRELTVTMGELVRIHRGVLQTGKTRNEQTRKSDLTLAKQIQELRELTSDNARQQARLDDFTGLITQWNTLMDRAIAVRKAQGMKSAEELFKTEDVRKLGPRVQGVLRDMDTEESTLLQQRHLLAKASAGRAMYVIGIGTISAILCGLFAAAWIARRVTNPVQEFVRAAERIGDGTLGHRVSVKGTDELAILATAMNTMAAKLEEAQEALQKQTLILESILSSMSDGVVVANSEGEFLFFNPAAGTILGKDPGSTRLGGWSEHFGLFLSDRVTPYPEAELPLARAVRGESVDRAEMFARRPGDSEGIWLEVTARPIAVEGGFFQGGLAVFSDFTARKAAEEMLANERNLLRTLIDRLPDYIFAKDTQGRFIVANQSLLRVLRASRMDDAVGMTDFDFFPRALAGRYAEDDREILRSGRILLNKEEPTLNPDGETTWLSTTKVPFHDSQGKIVGLVGICHDITEGKRTQEQICRLNTSLEIRAAELETVNKELEAFSYSVSHDLRAPLRHVDGFAELLSKHSAEKLDDKGRRYVKLIAQSAKEMGHLIDDLLVFSRMGRSEMHHAIVDLDNLTADVIRELTLHTEDRAIRWRIASLGQAQVDRAMFRLVLVNLISNALKYTRTRPAAEIEIGCHSRTDAESVLFIRDNGVGFDMQYVDKLFGVFQRLHSADAFEGTGIGLANVRRIIHRHGGRTWAEGAVDLGATFYFSLPLSAAEGIHSIPEEMEVQAC